MKTDGKEKTYKVGVDEAFPVLHVTEDGHGAETTIPERLVKRFLDAQAKLEEAEFEIARWVKYSRDPEAKAALRPLIERLPSSEERKKR